MLSDSTRVRWPLLARAVVVGGVALLAAGMAVVIFAVRPDFSLRLTAVVAMLVGFTAIAGAIVWNALRGGGWSTRIVVPNLPGFLAVTLLIAALTLFELAAGSGEDPWTAFPAAGAAWLALLATSGAYWWRYGAGHLRHVGRRAPRRIGETGPGWVHVTGDAFLAEGAALMSGIDGKPCLWYRVNFNTSATTAEDDDEELPAVDASQSPFGIRDESGAALVLPVGADVVGVSRGRRSEGDWEWIAPGDRLHVVGHLSLVDERVDLEAAVSGRLIAWRGDPARRAEFDVDGDGRLGTDEDWAMRTRALAEAEAEARAASAAPPARIIGQGDGSRRFLVSAQPPERLAGRFRFWAVLGAASFAGGLLGALALGAWLLVY